MNRIEGIGRLLLMIFLFNICNCWEGDSTKGDWKSGSSPFYIYFLLVVLPSVRPDSSCTTSLAERPKLQISTPIQANTSQIYVIYPERKPVKVRITLLENNCRLFREYFYCSANKLKSGSLYKNTTGIACSDGVITEDQPIEGNIGTFEECELSYNGEIFQAKVIIGCKYEIQYN